MDLISIRQLWLALGALASIAPASARAELDLARYAELLNEYTIVTRETVGTRVDYRGLASDERWSRLITDLEASRPSALETREARLAFWINAYNILAIRTVIDHYPVASIRDVGSFFQPVWKHEVAQIEGEKVTLHWIEHDLLRKLGEPRIHGAIVCASTSCPSLARTPYTPDLLDAQLDAAIRRWMADRRKGLRVDRDDDKLWLSRIFEWFEEDFAAAGGVVAFATRYAPEPERAWLDENAAAVLVEYFDYDWSLNDWKR